MAQRLRWQVMDTVDVPGAVYLDHAATTPMLPEAIAAMTEAMRMSAMPRRCTARAGERAAGCEESRETIAAGARRPSERGRLHLAAEPNRTTSRSRGSSGHGDRRPRRRRILASAVEHHAVLDMVEWLA